MGLFEWAKERPRFLRVLELAALFFASAGVLILFIPCPPAQTVYLAAWLTIIYAGAEALETKKKPVIFWLLIFTTPTALIIFVGSLLPAAIYTAGGQTIFSLAGQLSGAALFAVSLYGWLEYRKLRGLNPAQAEKITEEIKDSDGVDWLAILFGSVIALIYLSAASLIFSTALNPVWLKKTQIIIDASAGVLSLGLFAGVISLLMLFSFGMMTDSAKNDLHLPEEKIDKFIDDYYNQLGYFDGSFDPNYPGKPTGNPRIGF